MPAYKIASFEIVDLEFLKNVSMTKKPIILSTGMSNLSEIEDAIASFRHSGVMYPIWIMPVGATEESQDEIAAKIAEQTMNRGYNVAARVHCYIWGNEIGR